MRSLGLTLLVAAAACLQAPPGSADRDGAPPPVVDGAAAVDAGAADRVVNGNFRHFCTVVDGAVWCWGNNGEGQLGDGTYTHRSRAVQVLRAAATPLEGALQVAPGEKHTCALLVDGTVSCWGSNSGGQLGIGVASGLEYPYAERSVAMLDGAVQLSAGGDHTCARRSDDSVLCWGRGTEGQIGDGAGVDRPGILAPVTTEDAPVVSSQVAAGRYHTCLIDSDDQVLCTGWNEDGQAGQRDGDPPEDVCTYASAGAVSLSSGGALGPATDLSASFRHTCALVGGAAYCFGHSRCGELGNDDPSPCGIDPMDDGSCLETTLRFYPVEVLLPGACQPTRIAVGYSHACALCADRTVQCWGSGTRGRLGQGTIEQHPTPVQVMDVDSAIAIAAGAESNCAALADRRIVCWGSAEYGQLGDVTGPDEGNTTLYQALPREVVGLPGG